MREDRIGTLRLEGEDVTNFVNSFFNPSEEEIADHASRMGRINNSISVRKNNLGFEAEIDGLDLSFLDDDVASLLSPPFIPGICQFKGRHVAKNLSVFNEDIFGYPELLHGIINVGILSSLAVPLQRAVFQFPCKGIGR